MLQQERNGLTAAAGPPLVPPRSWFEMEEPEEPTGWTVTADGQVFGHAALWGTCHTGKPGRCVTPPKSQSDYSFYKTGLTEVDDGELIPTGRITLGTGHASLTASPAATAEHYDNTGSVVADVNVRDGKHGIWVSGALRPDVPPERIRTLRGASLSGDWRSIRGALEMLGLLAVNVPGFPVPRAMTASGEEDEVLALVAAGTWERQELYRETLAEQPVVPEPTDEEWEDAIGSLTAAADRSKKYLKQRAKVKQVMREFKAGKLKSGSGGKVTSRKQAIAIALSEARRVSASATPEQLAEIAELAAAAFDESKHPRHKKGSHEGGQFAPKGGGDDSPAGHEFPLSELVDTVRRGKVKNLTDSELARVAKSGEHAGEVAAEQKRRSEGGKSTVQEAQAKQAEFKFRGRKNMDGAMSYMVEVQGEGSQNDRTLGWVTATSPAQYPGRSKATYTAHVLGAQGGVKDLKGTHGSREEGARAIVDYLQGQGYGKKKLAKIGLTAAGEVEEASGDLTAAAKKDRKLDDDPDTEGKLDELDQPVDTKEPDDSEPDQDVDDEQEPDEPDEDVDDPKAKKKKAVTADAECEECGDPEPFDPMSLPAAAPREPADFGGAIRAASFTEQQRAKLVKKGKAMKDGSFPIRNRSDLRNAIQSVGRASDPEEARRWIIKRARQLKAIGDLPASWNVTASAEAREEEALEAAGTFVESKHPRFPKGDPHGGQFAPKGQGHTSLGGRMIEGPGGKMMSRTEAGVLEDKAAGRHVAPPPPGQAARAKHWASFTDKQLNDSLQYGRTKESDRVLIREELARRRADSAIQTERPGGPPPPPREITDALVKNVANSLHSGTEPNAIMAQKRIPPEQWPEIYKKARQQMIKDGRLRIETGRYNV